MSQKDFRSNRDIRASEVRVIDHDGTQLGVMSIDDALARAAEQELDLVEVSPQAKPPVCKITDFGALKFNQQKQLRKQKAKQKKLGVKGVRISMNIGEHDLKIKADRARKFLDEGHKVKIELIMRGRQRAFRDQAIEQIKIFEDSLGMPVEEEVKLSFQGNRISKVIGKK